MAKTVQVHQEVSSAEEDYDAVHELAKQAGKEKAFLVEFGTKTEYLRKCHVEEAL